MTYTRNKQPSDNTYCPDRKLLISNQTAALASLNLKYDEETRPPGSDWIWDMVEERSEELDKKKKIRLSAWKQNGEEIRKCVS